ncbi:CAP domain-containing protein [Desulfosporosinus burensis]
MKRNFKLIVSIHMVVFMTLVALPVQAAINIGAPRPLTGSVVTLRSSGPVITPVIPTPVPTQNPVSPSNQGTQTVVTTPSTTNPQTTISPSQWINIGPEPTTNSGSVISLKNILNQPNSIPVTATPTPVPVPVTTTTAPAPTLPVIPPVIELTADEQLMVDMINQERLAAGLNPVIADLRLTAVGRAKANDLKVNNYFSHTSPTYGSPWAMMQQVGITIRWAGENISGNKSVSGSMASLMQSPGHRANILDPRFTHVGVGIAYGTAYGNLYVQEFLQQ